MANSKINASRVGSLVAGVLFLSIGFSNYSYFAKVATSEETGQGTCGIPKGQAKIVRDLNWLLGWFGVIVAGIAIFRMLFSDIKAGCE